MEVNNEAGNRIEMKPRWTWERKYEMNHWEWEAMWTKKNLPLISSIEYIVDPYELYELYDLGEVPELYGTL